MSNDDRDNKNAGRDKRRSVVKGITIAGTGVTLSHWTKPVVESIVLPAHAQTSLRLFAETPTFVIPTQP